MSSTDTPRSCPACLGMPEHAGCRVCGGAGIVDAATAARWASAERLKASSSTIKIADLVALIVNDLRNLGQPEALKLADEGQAILDEIAKWRLHAEGANGPERLASYTAVGPWQRKALELLIKSKSPSGQPWRGWSR